MRFTSYPAPQRLASLLIQMGAWRLCARTNHAKPTPLACEGSSDCSRDMEADFTAVELRWLGRCDLSCHLFFLEEAEGGMWVR